MLTNEYYSYREWLGNGFNKDTYYHFTYLIYDLCTFGHYNLPIVSHNKMKVLLSLSFNYSVYVKLLKEYLTYFNNQYLIILIILMNTFVNRKYYI